MNWRGGGGLERANRRRLPPSSAFAPMIGQSRHYLGGIANMERLFVYGSLKDPAVQQRILGRVVAGTPDMLDGHTTRTLVLDDGAFPILYPEAGSTVTGLI